MVLPENPNILGPPWSGAGLEIAILNCPAPRLNPSEDRALRHQAQCN
jgi:hypothetical protein